MSYETILVERKEDVGIIKLNRPEKRNALGAQLIEDMLGALDELDNDPGVHVIVLTSNVPRIFSAGRDLAEASADMTAHILKQREISRNPARLWLKLRSLRKVVIAAVSGYALAGGTGIAACCDLVVAAEDAVFGLPEINVGLWPMTISPSMVHSIPTVKKCFELYLTGDRFSAEKAEQLGLVNTVVPSDQLEEKAMELAKKIAQKSPTTIEVGKRAFYNMMDMEYTKAVDYATEMLSIVAVTDNGIEGQKAFVEKRKPEWKKPE